MAEPTTTPAPSVGRAAFVFILVMVAFDFLAAAGGMVGSIWPASCDSDFVLRIEHRLHFYGGGAVTSVAASGPHHFRDHHLQRVNSFRVRHRCDEAGRARQAFRSDQRCVWTWIRNRARRGR